MDATINAYLSVGAVIWVLVCLRVIYCVGKYAFIMSFKRYPDLEDVPILPGWNLLGENNTPWAGLAIGNIGIYVGLSWILFLPLWSLGIFFVINAIINYNRKKRFD